MQKFEINNPVALKFIADFKSGVYTKPYIEKIKKLKWVIVSVAIVIVFIIFFNIGKSIFRSKGAPVFTPPNLDTERIITPSKAASDYDELKNEIFNFSTDLPDPVMPDFDNKINLQKQQF